MLFTFGFVLSILIGAVRYLTGPELALSVIYLIPIFIVTIYVGRWAGIIISITSASSWLAADLMMLHTFSNPLIPYINETFRLTVFLVITFILSELSNTIERQKELAMIDPLTQIANRRAFIKLSRIEIKRARRFKHPLSVAYIDIDNFKYINDNFGHSVGDNLLSLVAETIKDTTRETDLTARLGGDEFVILMSDTEAESAYLVANKIQKKFLHLMQENEWPVTCSIGLVTFNCSPDSIDDLIKEADNTMYSAKQNGKNMIKHKIVKG